LEQPALWEQDNSWAGFQWLCADDNQSNTVSFLRLDKAGKPLLVVCNFSPVHRDGYRVGAPFGGTWTPILNTDDPAFGGQGLGGAALKTEPVPCHDQEQSLVLDLPPMSALIYRCTRKNPVRKPKEQDKTAPTPEASATQPDAKKAPARPKKKAPAKKAAKAKASPRQK
jgi:1,4-alpha-glucan branching enzyme